MKITPAVFEAYLKCPTKCWLRATGEAASGNTYAEWVQAQIAAYRETGTARLVAASPQDEVALSPDKENVKAATWRLASSLAVLAEMDSCALESELHAVERVPAAGRGKAAQFIPIRFVFTNKLGKDDKLLLALDAVALSKALKREVSLGKIIHGDDHATLKVKTSALAGEVRKRLEKIAALLANPAPPDLVLNRHCGECEFQARCRKIAIEKDDLSLLANMSAKERQKLRNKGIFTVTQLSYTFRPRRRPKKQRDKREKYHHSLKALAIREKKIHIVGSPELKIEGTPVYLDVEGLPDRDFYYLIGLRIGNGESAVQHSLWADTVADEGKIWREFLAILETVEKPVLIHYGSYETTFLKRMCAHFGEPPEGSETANAFKKAVNLLSVLFAQIYFTTFSNGLKEIAGQLGFQWADPADSGVQTIRWRNEWDVTRMPLPKETLFTYNAKDCEALEITTQKVVELCQPIEQSADSVPNDVVHTAKLKWEHPHGFKRNALVSPELNAINRAAYWNYQRARIYVKTNRRLKEALRPIHCQSTIVPINKTIDQPAPEYCPQCHSPQIKKWGSKCSKIVKDLKFMRSGIKRWIIRYRFSRFRCTACGTNFTPPDRPWSGRRYGPGILAFSVYMNIEFRLPLVSVDQCLNSLLALQIPLGTTGYFKAYAAEMYRDSYKALLKRLCHGQLLHVDETKISVKGRDAFVWVFTNMEEVAYVYSETRVGDLLQDLLKDFKGVLVSDFYAAYDGIQCPQQKCLVHLIRDLNDGVLQRPFDEELKQIVSRFTALLKPMVDTIEQYGLKGRFLRKHIVSVSKFYTYLLNAQFQSEAALKLKERFEKNRDKLYTFLENDGVPWNNNNAECAIKGFATLRRLIDGVTSEHGLRDYLVLLSLCKTCKYMGLDFLDFLRSGEKDVHVFAESRRGRRHRPSINEPIVLAADEIAQE